MNTNGADAGAHLAARVAALEAALEILTRELGETWRPRLLQVEADVEQLAAELAARDRAHPS